MKYIIHGASGAQGAPLFRKLLKVGKNAVAAVRDPEKLVGTPAVAVNNTSVDSLVAAYDGAEGVFIHLPVGPEDMRLQHAKNISKAIEISKPKRVVISTSGWVIDVPGSPLQYPDDSAAPTLVREIEKTGVSIAVIAPRLFLENLLMPFVLESAKKEGILPYPIRADYAVSWGSHLDVADIAAELFNKTSVTGIVGVGQLPAITGIDLANAFSKYFGREVTFKSLQPEEFGKILVPLIGEGGAAGVVTGYKAHYQATNSAINMNTSAQKILGITPRTVEQWLSDLHI